MMEPSYHPQPHNDDDHGVIASSSSFDSFESQETGEGGESLSAKPRISPRSQRRISPWAMDLQLKRGPPASKTQRSTSSWKMRMQQRKMVYGGVAVAEEGDDDDDDGEEEFPIDDDSMLIQPDLNHVQGPTPQQKALKYVQEQRKQKQEALEQQQQQKELVMNEESSSKDLGTLMEDSILEEDEEEDEETASPDDIAVDPTTTTTTTAVTEDRDTPDDEFEGLSEIEILRKRVIYELKQVLSQLYIGDQYIVESWSTRDPTEEELLLRRHKKNKNTPEVDGQKQVVMQDLAKRVSGLYTKDHHVVEAMSALDGQILEEEDQEEIGQADAAPVPTLSLQEQQQHQQTLTTLPPSPMKDLPRANFRFASQPSSPQDVDDDDEVSVFTEVTIEEMVQTVVPPSTTDSSDNNNKKTAFKDQMRKSFLAFEQLVHAKHQIDNVVDDSYYDEETVFEEYSIVHDDSKTVMTEMTTEELIEQVVMVQPSSTSATVFTEKTVEEEEAEAATPSKDTLENFQMEMRKSFAAFEALLGDDEFDEEEDESNNDDGETCEESFDEVTVLEGTTIAVNGGSLQQQQEEDEQHDEVTAAETLIAELAGVVESPKIVRKFAQVETPTAGNQTAKQEVDTTTNNNKEQRKEEKIKQFQKEMKKSFTAFESLLLKQSEKEDDDEEEEDANSCASDEYTVEEIVDQVTAGDDSKLFAKEMQKSFLAFESLLKQSNNNNNNDGSPNSKEDESVWEEETVQETVQGSAATPHQIASSSPAALPLSPARSVASSKASERSGKTYEDAISLVGENNKRASSGTKYDDAIMVVDADEEEKSRQQTTTTPSSQQQQQQQSYNNEDSFLEEEKKDGDSLLHNTQQFLNAIGGMVVSFDKGDNTETTEQETLSGEETRGPENAEKKEGAAEASNNESLPTALPGGSSSSSSPTKKKSDGPELVLTKPEPKTPSPTKKFTHQRSASSDVNILTNSRMFSDIGLVLPSAENKKSKAKTPQKNLPVMNVEFNHQNYDDDDDMTQITFDHTIHETPLKQRTPSKEEEGTPEKDETGSTCSSQASKSIADMLRRDIWSPELLVVQTALEKLGMEAVKGRSYRSHIVKFGGLLGILRAMDMNPYHPGIQLAACQALERLALDPETQMSIGGVGGIPVVATAMQNNASNLDIQRAATAALVNISCCPQDNIEGALESVILSMTKHANDTEVQENSFKVLANLTMDSPTRLKELSNRGGLAAMTMALQKPWSIKAEHHEAISLLSMLLRNLAECNQ